MIKMHRGSTSVYADLGRADEDEMLVKAQLADKIGGPIKRRCMTQTPMRRTFFACRNRKSRRWCAPSFAAFPKIA